jgi:hypothetical protein
MIVRARRRHAPRAIATAFIVSLVLAAIGCGGPETSVTQTWKAPMTPTPLMRTIIVFGAHMDEANRRVLEDGFVAELGRHGVAARPSYILFPGDPPSRDKAREVVRAAGFEGILVATMKNVRERETYVPGAYGGGFWSSYYGAGWGLYSPGYVTTDEVVSFETTLWDTRAEDRLVWATFTETINPSSGQDFVRSLTKKVLEELEKGRLVLPEKDND